MSANGKCVRADSALVPARRRSLALLACFAIGLLVALVVRVDPATETACFGQPEVVAFLQINDDIANRL